jgi:hypothetical protein
MPLLMIAPSVYSNAYSLSYFLIVLNDESIYQRA